MVHRILACILIIGVFPPFEIHAFAVDYQKEIFDGSPPPTSVIANSSGVSPRNSSIKAGFVIAPTSMCPLVAHGKPHPALVGDKRGIIRAHLVRPRSFGAFLGLPVAVPSQTRSRLCNRVGKHYVLFASPISGHAPLTVTFTATGLPSAEAFTIGYGDGSASDSLDPVNVCMAPAGGNSVGCPTIMATHTYELAGKYRATLATAGKCLPTSPGRVISCKPAILAVVRIMIW